MNRKRLGARMLAALLGALLTWPVLSQENLFTPNFREDTNIEQVIEVVADITGRTIIPDPRARGTQIRLYNSTPMTADQLWATFLEILQTVQLAAHETDSGNWRIVPEQNVRSEVSSTEGTGAQIVTRAINVDNISAAQLVPVLRPMIPQTGQFGAVPNSNSLIIVDRADNAARIEEIIRLVDNANVQDYIVVPLQFASAEDLSQKLNQFVQTQSAGGAYVGVQIIPDERTNSVILTGTQSQLSRFRAIAEEFDRPSTQGGGSQVRYLNYGDAQEIAENLQQQFGGAQVVEDAETAVDPTGGNVTVWADVGTNSIVMAAPSSVMRDMLAIVDALDIPRAQVHIQAIIVEMSETRAAELGLTWLIDGSGGEQAAALTNFSAIGGGILSLAQIGATGTPDPSILPDGVIAAVGDINDGGTSWAAVVSALQGDGQTNVMQLPELVVLDNEEGAIVVGQEVPFQSGQFVNAGNQGAINPFSTIERQDVGTTLTITPRINEGTGMRLEIVQEVSSLSSSTLASDVITNERRIETAVFVDDGDILVLGGLIDDQLRENEQRVPGLGRIPGLRWLFRGRRTDRSKTNLMVFIRPTILRDSLAASQLSTGKYRALYDENRQQAEEPVQLMRDAERPAMPPLEPDETGTSGEDPVVPLNVE